MSRKIKEITLGGTVRADLRLDYNTLKFLVSHDGQVFRGHTAREAIEAAQEYYVASLDMEWRPVIMVKVASNVGTTSMRVERLHIGWAGSKCLSRQWEGSELRPWQFPVEPEYYRPGERFPLALPAVGHRYGADYYFLPHTDSRYEELMDWRDSMADFQVKVKEFVLK